MSKLTPDSTTTCSQFNIMDIPHSWSAEQAMVVWEFLDVVAAAVWERYEPQLLTLIKTEIEQENTAQLDLFNPDHFMPDFDDDLPEF